MSLRHPLLEQPSARNSLIRIPIVANAENDSTDQDRPSEKGLVRAANCRFTEAGSFPKSPLDSSRLVYLMRGLPSCGKSTRAKELVAQGGIVLETDSYFRSFTESGATQYAFDSKKLSDARKWVMERFIEALTEGISPIVIDRGNGVNSESRAFARKAKELDYHVEICEPTSEWWLEIRTLLRYRPYTNGILDAWAGELAEKSKQTHCVSSQTIRRWMECWQDDVTVADILQA